MSKFLDLGRRNIADAIGNSLNISNNVGIGHSLSVANTAYISSTVGHALYISNTAYIGDATGHSLAISTTAYVAVEGDTNTSGEGLVGICLTPGNSCYGVYGYAPAGDYSGYFYNGKGLYSGTNVSGEVGVKGTASGSTAGSYAGEFASDNWNALRVDAPPSDNGHAQLWVSGTAGNLDAVVINTGGAFIDGNLTVTGSKSGYVVDVMQNVDSTILEPGDVVVIVGSGAPVYGQIPLVLVKKATQPYDSSVTGVVDQAMYVPSPDVKAAYEKQQAAIIAAEQQRNKADAAGKGSDGKPNIAPVQMPDAPITDDQGRPHATDAPNIPSGGYMNVVTLGSYKAVKADASFGPIHAGDLLTTSPHAGYAMKVTDKSQAFGAVIGKALADLDSGTGLIPVMVTLK
jgi:hypothetical protein